MFRYIGLGAAAFAPFFALDDEALAARSIRRMIADKKPGFPCRVTLEDAEPGERVLLLAYQHQPAQTPYRASGPIFVREEARRSFDRIGDPPAALLSRLLSVRAYDGDGMMVDADVVPGDALEPLLERCFADAKVSYAHIHYARRGCYAARVERGE